jgi:hypothetical protein
MDVTRLGVGRDQIQVEYTGFKFNSMAVRKTPRIISQESRRIFQPLFTAATLHVLLLMADTIAF